MLFDLDKAIQNYDGKVLPTINHLTHKMKDFLLWKE